MDRQRYIISYLLALDITLLLIGVKIVAAVPYHFCLSCLNLLNLLNCFTNLLSLIARIHIQLICVYSQLTSKKLQPNKTIPNNVFVDYIFCLSISLFL